MADLEEHGLRRSRRTHPLDACRRTRAIATSSMRCCGTSPRTWRRSPSSSGSSSRASAMRRRSSRPPRTWYRASRISRASSRFRARPARALSQIEFVGLSGNRVLTILVVNGREVQNRVVQLDRRFSHG
jgi:heat-inducible transcriptional repressor